MPSLLRRRILHAATAVFAATLARAQPARAGMRRVAWLTAGSPTTHAKLLDAFRAGLREHGWVEGRNLVLELRWAEGRLERIADLAAEVVRSKPDVILTAANVVNVAMRQATSTIPIVMAASTDPVGAGLAQSLARPGGNATGVTGFYEATPVKMLEIATSFLPRGARLAVLVDTGYTTSALYEQMRASLESFARTAEFRLEFIEAGSADEVTRKLDALARNKPAALLIAPGALIYAMGSSLVKSAGALGLPVIYPFEEMVDAGGLMSYSVDLAANYRRAARYVDLILRGADPGTLSIEQPTHLALVLNLRTAKALGLALPRELLARADRVVD
ncbi:MAG TPA: ABC transporter substrate-binding protein [Casimicrobiaceae bacterium]|nr:ABC transporter substrate-binding protein [Casimicrobiaceae bacterium]